MSKTVRRFMQDDIWNLGRNESWFSDMAKKGLHLRRIGLFFATFEKAEPQKTKFSFGNEVIYVEYFGKAQAEDIIALLPQAFAK
ncbi:DUF2812 domain-containing protein [Candidatus Formimonas warabiya]|uniref:Uncharacterized protein n=1 Tax=Formimonas warabiya TaxID=1761012 RepID=A0A3G1KM43_FORW1|nr:DUF2812 domain-containing protein [Candidatus Formimonas warabiya]ATW23513.1 hypothetical protein DCMF_00730 [Candidatus Formimonas warabiya]